MQTSHDVGTFWIDKTLFIKEFFESTPWGYGGSARAFPAIHRPRGFGKTTLLKTISWFVDANAQFDTLAAGVFDDTSLYATSSESLQIFSRFRESMLVLELDLGPNIIEMHQSHRGFEWELRALLSESLRYFADKYEYLLDLPPDYLDNPDIRDKMGFISLRAAIEVYHPPIPNRHPAHLG